MRWRRRAASTRRSGGGEDYELNWRLRARGETVWFDPELVITYRPRNTVRDLAWQYFNYGRWKRVVTQRHPTSLLPRHLASPLLLLGLAASPVLAAAAGATSTAAAVLLTYFLTLTLGSLAIGIRRRSFAALLLPLVLATMHLSWGIGFFIPVRTRRQPTVRRRLFGKATAALSSVSVLIPARNAEATIGAAIDSVLSQDYKGPVEVIVADGSDTTAVSDLVRRRVPDSETGPQPGTDRRASDYAQRNGWRPERSSCGATPIRCSHPDTCAARVSTLRRTGAANVGGRQQPVGITFFGRAVAMAMTTPLGAGGRPLPTGRARSGPVDTVFLGAFRREALEAAGGVDPTFVRNQDYELNWRLRARGETVWFDPELVVTYRPRSTLRDLAWQYFNYGRWKRVVARRHPTSLLPRHLASPLLLLGFGRLTGPGRGRRDPGGGGSAAHLFLTLTLAPWRSASAAVRSPRSCSRWSSQPCT